MSPDQTPLCSQYCVAVYMQGYQFCEGSSFITQKQLSGGFPYAQLSKDEAQSRTSAAHTHAGGGGGVGGFAVEAHMAV